MISAVTALVLAFIATTLLTPWVRRLAMTTGVVDQPGGRHVHEHITPRLGGVAVIAGFFVPLMVFALVKTNAMRGFLEHGHLVVGLVVGSAVVGVVGAIDDVKSLGPWAKLGAQTVAAVIAFVFGYRIDVINVPLFGDLDMGIFALPVTVFWFLAITNAINLIDGLDGLASGIALFATISNFAIAYMNDSHTVVLLSASLGGALLGFLRYNFNPAIIFLGDSGSMFLGFVLAATSLAGATTKSSTAVAILAPIIALGVPIIDTLLAMVRRTLARQSIFAADRKHIHHKLLDLGLTHRRVVLTLYGLSVALAFAAIAIAFGRSALVGASLLIVGVVVYSLVRALRAGALTAAQAARTQSGLCEPLIRRVGGVVSLLEQARDEWTIRSSLESLNGTPDIDVQILASDPAPGQLPSNTLVHELSWSGRQRFLQLCLAPPFSLREADVAAAIGQLVTACRDAVERVSVSTEARPNFHVTPAHSGSKD